MGEASEIIVVNRYALKAGAVSFVAAVAALVRRVEAEGHPGVVSYCFYCPECAEEGRAVVRYTGPEAWIGHHDIAMDWPEMTALRATADLVEVALHGPLTDAMKDWMARAGLLDRVRHQGMAVAGFTRRAG
jgi:hypothetical protein